MSFTGKSTNRRRKNKVSYVNEQLSYHGYGQNQSIKDLFQCRKVRRSHRLEIKEKTQFQADTIAFEPLGFLQILPLELNFNILRHLNIEDLSMLTITSKCLRNLVELYRNSASSYKHLLPNPIQHQFICPTQHEHHLQHFKRLGLLLKRSTCLYATKDRLCIMQQFLKQYLCNQHKSCADPSSCIALLCYGTFLHTVIAGWDEKECLKVLEMVGDNTNMFKNLHSIVKLKPGAYPSLEVHVRLFFRRVFLDVATNKYDRAWWLHHILKAFPIVHQARLIFLFYGPLAADEILWHEMCENAPQTQQQTLAVFGDLAKAFALLHHYNDQWSETSIISVIDEITMDAPEGDKPTLQIYGSRNLRYIISFKQERLGDRPIGVSLARMLLGLLRQVPPLFDICCPEEWLSENVANLLFQCGDCIVLKVLASKAINGRVLELANIITSLCMVAIRLESPSSRIVNLVHNVLSVIENSRDKITMLYAIVDGFKDYILDLHEFPFDAESNPELEAILEAQARFTKEIILMAFRSDLIQ